MESSRLEAAPTDLSSCRDSAGLRPEMIGRPSPPFALGWAKKAPLTRGGSAGPGTGPGEGPSFQICSRGWERSVTDLASVTGYKTIPGIDSS